MIKNNVLGTKITAEFALQKKVKKFIFISSDKAVNPKSILGFSKNSVKKFLLIFHLGLKKIQYSFYHCKIWKCNWFKWVSNTYFPKSNSKICLHLTVTSKKVTRYFMSISEAIQLVIKCILF